MRDPVSGRWSASCGQRPETGQHGRTLRSSPETTPERRSRFQP